VNSTVINHPVKVVSTSQTLPVTSEYFLAEPGVGSINLTLPPVAGGLEIGVKLVNGGSGFTATLLPQSGTIDGAANYLLSSNYQFVRLLSDGTNWYIVGKAP
jgi:hypothetical protein